MKVIFMGTPDFSVPVLEALVEAGHDIVAVYCQPPRRSGRGKKERPTPVHARAIALGLEVRHPVSLKTQESQEEFAAFEADIAVVVAYGLILPQTILSAPTRGCLNIHASLLPRWRGAAPIHRAIMAGDSNTGICIMQMDAGLDTGDVLCVDETPIGVEETTEELHDRLSIIGAALIVKTLDQLENLTPKAQPETGVTYAKKIEKTEARIDWSRGADFVDRQIRGLSPFPGAWVEFGGQRLKILASRQEKCAGKPGEVLDDNLAIACGEGAVRLLRLQRAGARAQDTEEFLHGMPIPKGTIF